jgi:hypothetical protein
MLHRDDVDFEEAEKIEAALSAEFGKNIRIMYAGDIPQDHIPEGLSEAIQQIRELEKESAQTGKCVFCENKIPDYAPQNPGWAQPQGWMTQFDQSDVFCGWVCPECDPGSRLGMEVESPEELQGDFE